MTDPRKHVIPGQRLALAASQVNFINSLMAASAIPQSGALAGWNATGNVVLIRNTTSGTIDRGGVLKITGIEIDPNDGAKQQREFQTMPCLSGAKAENGEKKVAVALEPLKPGAVGRCAVAGVVQVKSADVEKIGVGVTLWTDGSWALVRLGGGGGGGKNLCGRSPKYLLSLTTSGSCGTGFVGRPHVDGDCHGPISSVEILDGGSGYARLGRVQPSLQLIESPAQPGDTVYTATIVQAGEEIGGCGLPQWTIQSVSISGGPAAPTGTKLVAVPLDGAVADVDAQLTVSGGSVIVGNGGRYYRESQTEPPIVFSPVLQLAQLYPSDGASASFTANVNNTVGDPDFGSIQSVTIDNPGSGYLDRVWQYDNTYEGIDFTDVQGYDGRVRQILGHEPNGCLKWYSVTTCDADTSGVCCVDGEVNGALTTQATCEAAGGVWHAGALADDLPGPCCP